MSLRYGTNSKNNYDDHNNGQNEKLLSSTFYRSKRRGTTIDP